MSDELCSRCQHPFDPHAFAATTFGHVGGKDVPTGGIVLCPTKGCECFSTWSVSQLSYEKVIVPSDDKVAAMRRQLQKG